MPDSIYIKNEKLQLDKEYTLTTRHYIWEGYDGYEELPNCANIDKSDDIGTMFNIILLFFEVIKYLNSECCELEPGVFGFDDSNKQLMDYIRQVIVFKNDIPYVMISSGNRINQI